MYHIAQCESGGRQYYASGKVVTSPTSDYGLFQINNTHLTEARQMGMNIFDPEGNIRFALYLYGEEGSRPWNSSSNCWSKHVLPKKNPFAIYLKRPVFTTIYAMKETTKMA